MMKKEERNNGIGGTLIVVILGLLVHGCNISFKEYQRNNWLTPTPEVTTIEVMYIDENGRQINQAEMDMQAKIMKIQERAKQYNEN